MVKNNFKIVVPVFNSEKWIKKCLDSIKYQTYKNYKVVVINDYSNDRTAEIIEREIKNDTRFNFIDNTVKKCALENTVIGIHSICKSDEDIIVILDGDDWLPSNDVLEYLNGAYQDDTWITWGQFKLLSTNKICKFKEENWCIDVDKDFHRIHMLRYYFSHLRTYKYFLFKGIKEEDLRDSKGNYYTTAGDVVVAVPMIEMAGHKHRKCLDKIMYVYNNTSSLNDMRVCPAKQLAIYSEIRHKPKYKQYNKQEIIANDINIDILVWTKDRACQADLLLRSIKDNFKSYNKIYFRYDYSTEAFKQGYAKLIAKDYGLNIEFIERTDFEKDTKGILASMKTTFMVAICDDDVFVIPTNLEDIMHFYTKDVAAVSMRMGEHITYCYGTNKPTPLPKFYPCEGNFLKWKWSEADPATDWGYPGAVNIHIYRTQWYRDMIKDFTFDNPNELEFLFNTNRDKFAPYILSFKTGRILNIPVNQVQTVCPTNPFGIKFSYTKEDLNSRWLNGEIIDTKNIYGYKNKGVNEEISLLFVNGDKHE
ncbi:hypothetical protein LCGC14_0306210 [marine sediment metagenome]|uniref:Glycosyltransferase 2-like domain-containing protein n=1 Tax=marine sediment metagenome TaxID=412755 RepID=A0A0F9U690_9ZZZZ